MRNRSKNKDKAVPGTVVIIGGGWGGCAAAVAARQANAAEVVLLERTDLLLGCGLAGGIMRNNGRQTAAEELIALGGGTLIQAADSVSTHRGVDFPGHRHASLYSTSRIESVVRTRLREQGVTLRMRSRVTDIEAAQGTVQAVVLHDGTRIAGDVFIEATGSAGPMGNCVRFGHGCAMCVLRCPSYGPRVSLTERLGLADYVGMRADGGVGSFSGSCELRKDSLAMFLRRELERCGVLVVPLPPELSHGELLAQKSCRQYALPQYAGNLVLLDTGAMAKLMTPFFPIDELRRLPGFEGAVFGQGCGHANSVRFLSRAPRDAALQVQSFENLFCAGEKAGFFVGHTEAMVTGTLAGHNAVRRLRGVESVVLPHTLACGDILAAEQEGLNAQDCLAKRYTFSGGEYFERMQAKSLYVADPEPVVARVRREGLEGLFAPKTVTPVTRRRT